MLKYTASRIALILLSAGVLYLAGARSFLMWGLAIVIGALLAFIFLPHQQQAVYDEMAKHTLFRSRNRVSEADRLAAEEDELLDAELLDAQRATDHDGAVGTATSQVTQEGRSEQAPGEGEQSEKPEA